MAAFIERICSFDYLMSSRHSNLMSIESLTGFMRFTTRLGDSPAWALLGFGLIPFIFERGPGAWPTPRFRPMRFFLSSGRSMSSFTAAVSRGRYFSSKHIPLLTSGAALIAAPEVFLFFHWPSNITAGVTAGVLEAFAVIIPCH